MPYGNPRQKYNRQLVFNSMRSMSKKARTRLKIIGATATAVFSLASVFTGTYAWFSLNNNVQATGMKIKIKTTEAEISTLKLVKYDYSFNLIGGEKVYNYLSPETGDVNSYYYDSTYDNNRGAFVRESSGAYIETELMNRYDPVDNIIHGGSLREMNCNSIYEATLSSEIFTNCYLQLNAIFDSQTPGANQICLSDCVNFEVFFPSDLSDSNRLFWDKANQNYHAYYPSYAFSDEADEHLYYKISYLSDLRNSNLSAEDLVDMEILTSSDIEGLTEEQKSELVRTTLGPTHSDFYSSNPKNTTSVAKNKAVTFAGTPTKTTTVYININYAPSQLEQYKTDIYRNNFTAIEDFYFDFNFTETMVA